MKLQIQWTPVDGSLIYTFSKFVQGLEELRNQLLKIKQLISEISFVCIIKKIIKPYYYCLVGCPNNFAYIFENM